MSTLIYMKLQRDHNNNGIDESWITRITMHALAVPDLYSHIQTTPPNVKITYPNESRYINLNLSSLR